MRTRSWMLLTSSLLSLSSVASAQVYLPPPPFAPPPPPHVYVRQRVQWHWRRPVPVGVYVTPAPPPVWVAPASPPPPVYVTPPPPPVVVQPQMPYYVQPQPVYQPYCCAAPPPPPVAMAAPAQMAPVEVVRAAPPKPQWTSRVGLGVTGEGVFSADHGDTRSWGLLGQLRYRAARHLGLELMAGYERSANPDAATRTDVPISFGLLVPFLGPEHALSPYFVAAAGLNFADLQLIDGETFQLEDSRTQFLGQLGGGLELRLGARLALNLDARVEARWNMNEASEAVQNTSSINGKPVQSLENALGLRLGVGATVYF